MNKVADVRLAATVDEQRALREADVGFSGRLAPQTTDGVDSGEALRWGYELLFVLAQQADDVVANFSLLRHALGDWNR